MPKDLIIMKIHKQQSNSAQIVAEQIKKGNVVIIPTDTIYGFSAIGKEGDAKIRQIKGREETKPFIELIACIEDFEKISKIALPEKIKKLLPASLTIIVPKKEELGGGTVALRCPKDEWLRNVIKLCGKPIFSTSVNRSGTKPLWQIEQIISEFENETSLIIDDGDKPDGKASTLIDICDGNIKVLRQGEVFIENI